MRKRERESGCRHLGLFPCYLLVACLARTGTDFLRHCHCEGAAGSGAQTGCCHPGITSLKHTLLRKVWMRAARFSVCVPTPTGLGQTFDGARPTRRLPSVVTALCLVMAGDWLRAAVCAGYCCQLRRQGNDAGGAAQTEHTLRLRLYCLPCNASIVAFAA